MIEWRPIAEFPDYQVSSVGSIRRSGKELKLILDRKGYAFAAFRPQGRTVKRAVSRLVVEAFLGPIAPGLVVRHLDGDKSNNRPSNLACGTPAENENDKRRHGTAPIGERHPAAKLVASQIFEIRSRYVRRSKEHGSTAIARDFGVTQTQVIKIVSRQLWRHLP